MSRMAPSSIKSLHKFMQEEFLVSFVFALKANPKIAIFLPETLPKSLLIINFDIRFSLSTETKIKEYNIEGESYEKIRTSFKDLNGMFSVDLTTIQSGTFNDRMFTKDNTYPSFQVEIEILKNNINPNTIFKLLISLLSLNYASCYYTLYL